MNKRFDALLRRMVEGEALGVGKKRSTREHRLRTIMAELEHHEILRKMLRADASVGAIDAALQLRLEAFDTVHGRADVAADVRSLCCKSPYLSQRVVPNPHCSTRSSLAGVGGSSAASMVFADFRTGLGWSGPTGTSRLFASAMHQTNRGGSSLGRTLAKAKHRFCALRATTVSSFSRASARFSSMVVGWEIVSFSCAAAYDPAGSPAPALPQVYPTAFLS
ncbi:hypothetical protein [Aurantiacibacter arachoides]|uniref:hypothetical protein n=1 Tax=Aurantiacibacter arachoides TaxID=1850444 RepID=UPI00402B298A